MAQLLMAKVVAIWLIENTSLTFKQIADFCGMHVLEVENLANQENTRNHGLSPIITGELTEEEIKRCEKDSNASLKYNESSIVIKTAKHNKASLSKFKKQNKPEAILWLLQNYNLLSNYQIAKLVGATSGVVKAVRTKTHWNYVNLTPKNPIALGFCTEEQILKSINKAKASAEEENTDNKKSTKK